MECVSMISAESYFGPLLSKIIYQRRVNKVCKTKFAASYWSALSDVGACTPVIISLAGRSSGGLVARVVLCIMHVSTKVRTCIIKMNIS
jgi:hypothetical protein